MITIYLIVISVIILIYAIFACVSQNFLERVIIFSQINSLSTLFIAFLASMSGREMYIDIAILYSLFSFIATKALLFHKKYKIALTTNHYNNQPND
jgi:multisubunit Na+/H+ antiporter MnhF subunit